MHGKHERVARGTDKGSYISADAAAYPQQMNSYLAAIAVERARALQRSRDGESALSLMFGQRTSVPPSPEERWERLHAFRDALEQPRVRASCEQGRRAPSAVPNSTILDFFARRPPAKRARPV